MAKNVVRIFERMEPIDRAAIPAQKALARFFREMPFLRDALTGKWMGRSIHMAVNDVPIGAFTTSLALDFYQALGGSRKLRAGADAALTVGLITAGHAAIHGLADFSKTDGLARRIAFVHATANVAAIGLYGASLFARKSGSRTVGVALSTLGFGVMAGSAWLGGAMVAELGVGVGEAAEVEQAEPVEDVESMAKPKSAPAAQAAPPSPAAPVSQAAPASQAAPVKKNGHTSAQSGRERQSPKS